MLFGSLQACAWGTTHLRNHRIEPAYDPLVTTLISICVYIYIYMRNAPTRTYLLWIHQTWTTFNLPVWTTSLCIPLPFCSELYPSTIHIVWTASLYYLVWTADFYWKEKGFLKGRLLSKQKSWSGKGRALLENSLIDKEESHLVWEEKRS